MDIRVQELEFDAGVELARFTAASGSAGAIVTFTGIVRDTPDGDLDRMEIEHYPGMTERALGEIAQKAQDRWDLSNLLILHRFGDLKTGETIMMVATASRHRVAAFEAAEYLMDYLKSRAPFWKKEFTKSGATWVASKRDDEDALNRWKP
ncbi:molybdenum cofactor biosynthesis protein MoaE [Falsihalocynthiibacter arcticus]|uniref:Molybdopterin synthase catalytic subunit n=1 Tax=Falsihalocynthiibacter arcticus TaxID=1579316 RepID=A0A126UYS5_9RHOB|nr:molybdenum cofactor biosynthesis protein MoaE [Falsihalocynthiibacter arcticus]AML51200.1 molybdenum cofactor biosynthesis protein MoaE [Falsihalocynthiibacter arcticus]